MSFSLGCYCPGDSPREETPLPPTLQWSQPSWEGLEGFFAQPGPFSTRKGRSERPSSRGWVAFLGQQCHQADTFWARRAGPSWGSCWGKARDWRKWGSGALRRSWPNLAACHLTRTGVRGTGSGVLGPGIPTKEPLAVKRPGAWRRQQPCSGTRLWNACPRPPGPSCRKATFDRVTTTHVAELSLPLPSLRMKDAPHCNQSKLDAYPSENHLSQRQSSKPNSTPLSSLPYPSDRWNRLQENNGPCQPQGKMEFRRPSTWKWLIVESSRESFSGHYDDTTLALSIPEHATNQTVTREIRWETCPERGGLLHRSG